MRKTKSFSLPEWDTYRQRIAAAFRAMRKSGIVAKQNFSCCSTCGHYEMHHVVPHEGKAGYAFYHAQAKENLVDGREWYIQYSSYTKNSEPEDKKIGEAIVAALRGAGLSCQWDGSPDSAIEVSSFSSFLASQRQAATAPSQ